MSNKMILILSLVAAFCFFWYSIRPANIRKYCQTESIDATIKQTMNSFGDDVAKLEKENYKDCLIDQKL